ncbi:hypothetical protein [Paenibacillus pinihumi]|nr:hypothetical protein [Paenibacillus pinihumi]
MSGMQSRIESEEEIQKRVLGEVKYVMVFTILTVILMVVMSFVM